MRRASMMNLSCLISSCLAIVLCDAGRIAAQQSERPRGIEIGRLEKVDAPVVLCIDDKPAVGGKPSSTAYAKAAANGFRSVLTLRAAADGVDIDRERFMVEQNKLRYFNIPAGKALPQRQQVD
jgi:hypothetical protein